MYVSRDSGEKDGFEIRLAPYTFIEFYDPSQTENICASLCRPPEKLIVFGGHPTATERFCAVYRDIMGKRGFDSPAEAVWVNPNNASAVESELRRVIVSEKENGRACAVDLTGGSDLCLFAAGRVAADYPDLRFHRYSVSRRIIYDSDPSGIRLGALEVPPLQMDELVRLCSGELMECAMRHSDPLSIPERAEERLGPVWDACRKNPAGWNRMTGELAKCLADPPEAVPAGLKRFLASWERLGYLRSDTDGGKFRVSFSDGASKLLLTRS
ncbi:MAG: hypothetical protein ILO68_06300, partial [Clostridia bacterium]|nr:hypothetical protein [Clostridia bacterium]